MIGTRKGAVVGVLRRTGVTGGEAPAGEMEERFFQLLEMDRESEDFLARFWELDRMLERALRAARAGTGAPEEASFGRS